MSPVSIYPVPGLPEISRGAPLASLIVGGLTRLGLSLETDDVVVVAQKIVSKAEGRVRSLDEVQPSARATEIGHRIGFDPRHVEVILAESVRIVREAPRVLITETRHGFVCANAGVDRSNGQVNVAIGAAGVVALRDYRGDQDPAGYQLQGTELGVVDELASAAELVMGKLDRVPVALIRGAQVAGEGTVRSVLRNPATDLFR